MRDDLNACQAARREPESGQPHQQLLVSGLAVVNLRSSTIRLIYAARLNVACVKAARAVAPSRKRWVR